MKHEVTWLLGQEIRIMRHPFVMGLGDRISSTPGRIESFVSKAYDFFCEVRITRASGELECYQFMRFVTYEQALSASLEELLPPYFVKPFEIDLTEKGFSIREHGEDGALRLIPREEWPG